MRARGQARSWSGSGCRSDCIIARASCPAASSSGWRWHAASCAVRVASWPTSRRATSTRRRASGSTSCSSSSTPNAAPRSWSRRTTPGWRRRWSGRCVSSAAGSSRPPVAWCRAGAASAAASDESGRGATGVGVMGQAMRQPRCKGWLGAPGGGLALGVAAGRGGGRVVAQEEEPSSEPQLLPPTHAPIPGETGTVAKVAIEGNIRVEEDAIRVHLQTQQGQPFDRETVDKDIRAIYGMGFFDQVNAEVTPSPKGITVTFRVTERPLVRNVTVEGNEKLKKEELEGALRIRPHTILDPQKARQGIDAAKKLYADKGYLDAKITYDPVPVGENEIDVHYTVTESEPVRVKDIEFEGNEAFSSRKLRSLLQTKEEWLLTPFTGAGNLNKDVLRTDVERLTAWYYDHGYVTERINEPKIERGEEGLVVVFKIDEGEEFKIGKVAISGKDLPEAQEKVPPDLATRPGEVFSASALRDDVQRLTEDLSEGGFAFANIDPQTEVDPEEKVVNVTFQVERGKPVTVDRIEVTGNTKTRDYVVRREMRLQEQELFSATKLRKSREAIQRLGFFSEVNVTTRKSPTGEDRMDVVVDVKEAQTGSFSAGAGFSSADSLLFNVRIQENNLFGRGQRLVLNGDIGSIRRNIILSFTEPYFR